MRFPIPSKFSKSVYLRKTYKQYSHMAIWRSGLFDMTAGCLFAHGDMALDCLFCTWRYGAGLPNLHMAIWRWIACSHIEIWHRMAQFAHGDMALDCLFAHGDMAPDCLFAHGDMAVDCLFAHGDMALDCPFGTWRYGTGLPIRTVGYMAPDCLFDMAAGCLFAYGDMAMYCLFAYGDMAPDSSFAHGDMATDCLFAHGDMALDYLFCTWRYGAGLPVRT